MNSSVEEVKTRINIVDLVGEYVRLQRAGANWRALCPFHNEKSPSFMVSEDKQIFHCFGCGKGGDIFGFLMELEGLEFKEALKILAERAGVKLDSYQPQRTDDKKKTLEILELATKFFEKQLWDGAGKEKILNYLRGRGLSDDSIRNFRLGYAPDGWRNLLNFLLERGYRMEEIARTGLEVQKNKDSEIPNSKIQMPNKLQNPNDISTTNYKLSTTNYYDRFRDRIMFPIADLFGKIIGFSARVAPGGDESQAKYVNTPESEVYHKSKVLYGIDKARQEIKSQNAALLVEGNMDVIALHQAGMKNTVAVSGTALTPDQLDILKRYSSNLRLFFDADEAGKKATQKSAEAAFQKDFNVSIVSLPQGKDAAELLAENKEELLQAVKNTWPAMEYFFSGYLQKYDIAKAEDKKIIAAEVVKIIANFKNEIEREHWVKKLAQALETEEKTIYTLLKNSERPESAYQKSEQPAEIFVAGKRLEMLREKLLGLALVDSVVWEKLGDMETDDVVSYLKADNLFSAILEKGQSCAYAFDKLAEDIGGEQGERARRLYFASKYQFDGEAGATEREPAENMQLMTEYFDNIRKEIYREKRKQLEKDIKKAEEIRDKEAVKKLMAEFSQISNKL